MRCSIDSGSSSGTIGRSVGGPFHSRGSLVYARRIRNMKFQISSSLRVRTRVGVDVGGTFTDVIVHGAEGRVEIRKLLSTPPSYDRAVVEAVAGLAAGPVAEVVHGTTVATNAVLERRGAGPRSSRPPASATCSSCGGSGSRTCTTSSAQAAAARRAAAPLRAERARDRGRHGRSTARRGGGRALAARLRETGVESVAVCLLHSYLYPEHEKLRRDPRRGAPESNVSLSSEILREQREYERSATTVVNAYVRPLMSRTSTGSGAASTRSGSRAAPDHAVLGRRDDRGRREERPVFALESGPAAGVVAARGIGRRLGIANLLSFDMGGTTAKASLIEGGAISRGASMRSAARSRPATGWWRRGEQCGSHDRHRRGRRRRRQHRLDGAGGRPAGRAAERGADPGPACYGRGGASRRSPTPTSSSATCPPAGRRRADLDVREAAEEAVRRVAEPLGLTLLEAASGIHRIANARTGGRCGRSRPRGGATRATSR